MARSAKPQPNRHFHVSSISPRKILRNVIFKTLILNLARSAYFSRQRIAIRLTDRLANIGYKQNHPTNNLYP
jgi:hypothetical protein